MQPDNRQGTESHKRSRKNKHAAQTLVDRTEGTLIDFIGRNRLKAGDLLPGEEDLADDLGVSRTVIRESLTRLKALGMVESVRHKGTMLLNPDPLTVMERTMVPSMLDEAKVKDLFAVRLALEAGMADFIWAGKTEEALEELEEIAESEPEHPEQLDFDAGHELMFHGRMYKMTGNETLVRMHALLLPVFQHAYDAGLVKPKGRRSRYLSHRQLVGLLKEGSPQDFREGLRRHLENHFSRLITSVLR